MISEGRARELIEKWRQTLAPEWSVEVHFKVAPDQDPDDVHASIGVVAEYRRAHLYYNPTSLDRPLREVERTACHEILHLVLSDLDDVADLAIRQMGSQAAALARENRHVATERAVDALARAFVP